MMSMRATVFAVTLPVLWLTACGSEPVVQPNVNVSIGQQLIDLKNARDSGALKEDEYRKQRKMLIDSVR
jgi:hypothetical protein